MLAAADASVPFLGRSTAPLVRNTPGHPPVASQESETFPMSMCVSAPASADGSRQRGCEAASEPKITPEMIGLSTESYLVPDCSDQSPNEGCGVVPGPSGCGPCPVPHPGGAAEVAALGLSKAPSKGLEVPKAGAVFGSLGQVLSQVRCPCSEQEGSEAKMFHSTHGQLLSVLPRSHP